MPMLFTSLRRAPLLAAALLVALAASGCAFNNPFASKNPLIDDEPEAKPPVVADAAPVKPVLPKPVLVVKPATETDSGAAKPLSAPAIPAAEPKPAVPQKPATPASEAPRPVEAAPAPTIARIADPGAPAPTGWHRWLGIFKPYKLPIQQGNFVSQDMAAKIRPGMTKEQVRFVLGTPLLTDMFHANRWDYLFRLQKPNGALTANRLAIFFVDNRVERIESSELPNESEYLSHIAGPVESSKPSTTPAKPAAPAPAPSAQP